MSKVLLLGCGTQGLAIAKDIKRAGHEVFVLGEKNNYADSSRYLTKFIYAPFSPSSQDYYNKVSELIDNIHIEVIIPMGDAPSEFLSFNKDKLQSKVAFKMPEINDWRRGVDKNQLMKLCKEKGFPIPYTITADDFIGNINKVTIPFPLLIKPNITCGARGMTLVHSLEELKNKYPAIKEKFGECHFQQYIKQGGAQVEVQLYVNEKKELLQSSVIYKYRWYPEKGGSSCCAVSIRNDKIVNILYHLLIDLNWVGFADFDTIEDPDTGELLIMELNPRVPACVKCAIEGGIKWGEIIVNGYLNQPQKTYKYNEGEYLRHLGFETLWFIKSPNRFRTKPNWFKFLGKHIHYQDMSDWSDPMPFIKGTFRNVMKVISHKGKERIQR